MPGSFPCPKCTRKLFPSGTIHFQGQELLTYQCDECISQVEMFGEAMELPLTFCVDAQGRAFDPASNDARPLTS
jgi:hypothetical protein